MLIYVLVNPKKDLQSSLHAFTDKEFAERALELYQLDEVRIVEIPLEASEGSLREWERYQWPVHVYFVLDEWNRNLPVKAFANANDYKELHSITFDHPYVDGALDGLKKAVEKGKHLYRVMMKESKEINRCEDLLNQNAVEITMSHLWTYDPDRRRSGATSRGNPEDGPYLVYVYADNEEQAKGIARPLLEACREHQWV